MNLLSVSGGIDSAIGFVVGAFTPAVGRKIKSWFVKESTAVKTDAANVVASAAASTIKKL